MLLTNEKAQPLPKHIPWRQGSWQLHQLNESASTVCLDGSPAAFSFWPAVVDVRNTHWLIAFQGGGWCWSRQDCTVRSRSSMGSSSSWHPPVEGGILARSCHVAPEFCTYNKVLFKYCDGASFAGNSSISTGNSGRAASVTSAGRAIVRAGIETLVSRFGLGNATDVLVTGSSAGALAALLHAENVREMLLASGAPLRRFKLLSISGLFFRAPTKPGAAQVHPFEEQLRSIFNLAQMTAPRECANRLGQRHAWRCLTGVKPLDAVPADIPLYVVQSTFDLWQTSCILGAGESAYFELNCSSAAWERCLRWMTPLSSHRAQVICSIDQRKELAAYQHATAAALAGSRRLRLAGSGAFIHACHDHAAYSNAWLGHRDRNMTMRTLVQRWWDSGTGDAQRDEVDAIRSDQHCKAMEPSKNGVCQQRCGEWRPNFYPDPRSKLSARIQALGLAKHVNLREDL